MAEEESKEPQKQDTSGEKLAKGDLAYLDFDLFIVRPDSEELFDTTREDSAKDSEIYDEKKVYEEMPFIVGEKRFLPGLDEALEGAEIGKDLSMTIPPDKGAGDRDPKLVEVRSMREFSRMKLVPEVGKEVIINNKAATIAAVFAGRVRVDFNQPLAGYDVKYDYKVTKKAKDREEKIRGIIDMDYGSADEFGLTITDDTAEILLPDVCKYDEKWFIAKYKVVSDLRGFADLRLIKFVEEYEKKEKVEEEKEEPEEKAEEASEEETEEEPEEKEEPVTEAEEEAEPES
ncbi:MAG: FKBP-type peptidyl-prolyl cis-trans isomerase [Thermoplasmata archaeon]|nr:FKBP-type peptidyl-prolyl cis-trans isomerase [Thermoplasmata archaeon]